MTPLLEARLLWASRSALAALLAFACLVLPNQELLPVPVLAPVWAIVSVERTIGGTLRMTRALCVPSLLGTMGGGFMLSNALRASLASAPPVAFQAALPLVVFVVCVALLTFLPARVAGPMPQLSVLMTVLCLGFPLIVADESSDGRSLSWHWPLRLSLTLLVGSACGVAASLLPGPLRLGSAWHQSRTGVLTLRKTSAQFLRHYVQVVRTNDANAAATLTTLVRKFELTLGRLETLLPDALLERRIFDISALVCCCCCCRRCSIPCSARPGRDGSVLAWRHAREIQFWRRQLRWLNGMRLRTQDRVGEKLGDDQRTFLKDIRPSIDALLEYMDDAENMTGKRLAELLEQVALGYQRARRQVLYGFKMKEGCGESEEEAAGPPLEAGSGHSSVVTDAAGEKQGKDLDRHDAKDDRSQHAAGKHTEWSEEEFLSRVCRRHASIHNLFSFVSNTCAHLDGISAARRANGATFSMSSTYSSRCRRPRCRRPRCRRPRCRRPGCSRRDLPPMRRPIKLAFTFAVASLWFAVPALRGHLNGFWITVTVTFVSQGDVGSSLAKCINRLIGTAISCACCLVTLRLVEMSITWGPVLLTLFVGAFSLFRDLPEHGYAALTAAFTTPVLLFGGRAYVQGQMLEHFIVARVEMTVLGVMLYMFIEMSLWPTRPRAEMKAATLTFFDRLGAYFGEARGAVDSVVRLGSSGRSDCRGGDAEAAGGEIEIELVDKALLNYSTSTVIDASALRASLSEVCAALARAQKFHHPAASEPRLSSGSYPRFAWKALLESESTLLCYVRALDGAVRQLRPAREHDDSESLVQVGLETVARTHGFLTECAAVLTAEHHRLGGGAGAHLSREAISRVSGVFRSWTEHKAAVHANFIKWYSSYFLRFRLEEGELLMQDGKVSLCSAGEGEQGTRRTLEQHNQIVLSAIIMSAEDVLRELGRIGRRLATVWLIEV